MLVEKEETGSTNDDARELALADAPHGALVLAARQVAGRGRAGRLFASPAGGLYASVVLRPQAPPHHWSVLPLLVGAGVASALRARGFPVELKWPNDLLLCGKKLGGVLVESRMGPLGFAVAGFGLNLVEAPRGVPDATALAEHGRAVAPRDLALAARDAILARVSKLDRAGPSALLPEIRALCATLGRRVEWEKGEGVAVDVANDGALVLEAEGTRVSVIAGDVRLRVR